MKTRIVLILITLLCAAMANVQSARAATITVANTNDSGSGSLRQALADATDGDTIDFSVTTPATITLTSGELLVNKSVTISGPGADQLSVNGNAASAVFHISPDKTVTISGLTITNGYTFDGAAGGIYNENGTLTINNSTLSGNSGFFNLVGGIFNRGGMLTINNSTFSDNSAPFGESGGVFNTGALTITNTTFSDNFTYGGSGGGIENGGPLTITNSTFSGNSAAYGGGIYNSGTLTISNTTLSDNSAGYGGVIYNAGPLTITNCTISGNSASGFYGGSGINNWATLSIGNTVLKAGALGPNIRNDAGATVSLGYNLSSDNGGGSLTAAGDQINTDPMLGPLQNNGGPTFTHELLAGSPAIDMGDPNFTPPPSYDQRGPGFDRVVNGRIDIGAFEVQAMSTPVPSPTPTATFAPTASATATATATPTATATATATATIPPSPTPTPTPTSTATPACAAQVQPPINTDGSSVFTVRRGVVPVKFSLTCNGSPTCNLPPATIAVTRTAGGVIGEVNESVYSMAADTGSNFRIDGCQYIYNLNSSALGVGTYRVDILINGQVVGTASFQLK